MAAAQHGQQPDDGPPSRRAVLGRISPVSHRRDRPDPHRRPGGATPSSTRSTSAASPTATATASATSPASGRGCRTCATSASTRSGSRPFYPSPMADGGYDVADYRDIDPLFGTLADADALIAEAHDLGSGSSSTSSPTTPPTSTRWFQAALAAGPGQPGARPLPLPAGPRRATASCRPTTGSRTFGGPAWTRVPDGEWYLHLFAPEQPDLNWDNPEVVDGVRGHPAVLARPRRRRLPHRRRPRLMKDQTFPDVGTEDESVLVPHEGPHHPFWDRDEVHDIYRGWRAVARRLRRRPRSFVAEAWVDRPGAARPLPPPRRAAHGLQLRLPPRRLGRRRAARDHRRHASPRHAPVGAPATWVLSNHDVTRHATRYGRLDRTGGGVADEARVGRTPRSTRRSACAGPAPPPCCMLALPGSAYVYQGEELGLPEVVDLPEDVLRRPDLGALRAPSPRPGRLPGADPVDRRRPVARLRQRRRRGCRSRRRLGRPVRRGPAGRRRARRSSSTAAALGCAGER